MSAYDFAHSAVDENPEDANISLKRMVGTSGLACPERKPKGTTGLLVPNQILAPIEIYGFFRLLSDSC